MTNAQIIDLALISINFSIATILLLFAYQKMPQKIQQVFNDTKVISKKWATILCSIMLIGVIKQIYIYVGTY